MPNEDIKNEDIKKEEGLTAEKVAKSLNASNEAKEAADKAADEAKEAKESLKSLTGSIESLVKGITEKKSEEDSESVKELKSEVALLKAKAEAANKGEQGGKSLQKDFSEKSLNTMKSFAEALKSKSVITFGKNKEEKSLYGVCGVLEEKSLRTFDNSDAGAFVPQKQILGDIEVNLQTVNPITSVVNNVNAGAIVAKELGYSTFDESLVDIEESSEGVGATESNGVVYDSIDIHVTKNSSKVKITDKTLHSAISGEMTANPITRVFNAIEKKYEKKIARKILNGSVGMGVNGIFHRAQESGSRIDVIPTETDNKIALSDLSLLCSRLKAEYLRNAVLVIDRAALYELYLEAGNDGHLKIEQFDYSNGLAALRCAEKIVPIIGVDSSYKVADLSKNDGFANYTPFSGSVTPANLAGYTQSRLASASGATDNQGKAVAVLANFNQLYSVARSSVVQMGYDQSFGNLLNDGSVWGGKIGYVGGDVTNQEAGAILYCK